LLGSGRLGKTYFCHGLLDAIASGRRPTSLQPDEEIVYSFCNALLYSKDVSDSTFKRAIDRFGERTVVDMTALVGMYNFVSLILNLDHYPLPNGIKPELRPRRKN
jgi:4-carboxymuconolactone decarboxylase